MTGPFGWITPSRHRLGPFELHRPTTIHEASEMLGGLDGFVCMMAGGMDLLNELKAGAPCDHLVDLAGITALRGVHVAEDEVRVGALVTHREVERSSALEQRFPGIGGIWTGLGNVRIRNAGTLVGNLVAGLPRYDVHPVLSCLEAEVVAADGATAVVGKIRPEGLLTAIRLPSRLPGAVAYERAFKPMLSCAVSLRATGTGWVARAAFGDVPSGPALEVSLEGRSIHELVEEIDEVRAAFDLREVALPGDVQASEGYRRRLAPVLVKRLLQELARRLQREEW